MTFAKLSTSQPANPQMGAEVALLSQLWETTLHHTPGIVLGDPQKSTPFLDINILDP